MAENKKELIYGKKAVIFDLDGTLVDSMWMWRQIDIEYLGRFSLELPEKLQEEIEGMSFLETAIYIKDQFGIKDSIEKMMDDWNEMAKEKYRYSVPLKPGAKEFLKACKEHHLKIGMATSNSKELVAEVAANHQLHDYFDVIITGSEGLRGKPFPDIYLELSKRLQVDPADCLVFEDILPGIMAGQSAGMKVCAVEDEYSNEKKEEKIKMADYYITDYYDFFS